MNVVNLQRRNSLSTDVWIIGMAKQLDMKEEEIRNGE
jgi:hypothetical protein